MYFNVLEVLVSFVASELDAWQVVSFVGSREVPRVQHACRYKIPVVIIELHAPAFTKQMPVAKMTVIWVRLSFAIAFEMLLGLLSFTKWHGYPVCATVCGRACSLGLRPNVWVYRLGPILLMVLWPIPINVFDASPA
ncbi:hypothetical protein NC652_009483 [Populus alba x Populus x berolinensis]|nr:hypothetical protein NC652_009483 [Populus alba x Populus x berolinensis]